MTILGDSPCYIIVGVAKNSFFRLYGLNYNQLFFNNFFLL